MPSPHFHDAETIGVQQLISAFSPVFPEVRVLRNVIIPLAQDSPIATAEIDAIVICSAGMFIFEVKGWHHAYVYREKIPDEPTRWFVRRDGCGDALQVKNPSAQGVLKMAYLRSVLPERVRLHYYVLMPCNGVEIDPMMPVGVITAADLPYLVRTIRKSGRSTRSPYATLDADTVDITAQMMLSMQGEITAEQHISNCLAYAHEKHGRHSMPALPDAVATDGSGLV